MNYKLLKHVCVLLSVKQDTVNLSLNYNLMVVGVQIQIYYWIVIRAISVCIFIVPKQISVFYSLEMERFSLVFFYINIVYGRPSGVGSLTHRLQNPKWPQGSPKWPTVSGMVSISSFFGTPVHFCYVSFLIRALLCEK